MKYISSIFVLVLSAKATKLAQNNVDNVTDGAEIPATWNTLPEAAGNHLVAAFDVVSRWTAQQRHGPREGDSDIRETGEGDFEHELTAFETAIANLPAYLEADIEELGAAAAWHAANTRANRWFDAIGDKWRFEDAAHKIKTSGYFSESLASDM